MKKYVIEVEDQGVDGAPVTLRCVLREPLRHEVIEHVDIAARKGPAAAGDHLVRCCVVVEETDTKVLEDAELYVAVCVQALNIVKQKKTLLKPF